MKPNATLTSVIIPVYRDAERARSAAASITAQALPPGAALEIVVVDDGSGDDAVEQLAQIDNPLVRILSLPVNVGRSAARNAGANAARGEHLIFMDCDCLPMDQHFVAAHLHTLRDSAGSTGRVMGKDTGFWSRYQHEASMRRERQYAAGIVFSGSSQSLAVRTAVFNAVGGFDTRYIEYGFEDRDLLLRLARHGTVAWTPEAGVRHLDDLTLRGVCSKMQVAGGSSAMMFHRDHPDAYEALGYARVDVRLHHWLRPIANAAGAMAMAAAGVVDRTRALELLPYPIAALTARSLAAMSYFSGTAASNE